MGNTFSEHKQINDITLNSFESYYSFVNKLFDTHFGEILLFQNKKSKNYIMKYKKEFVETLDEVNIQIQELKMRSNLSQNNLMKILGYIIEQGDMICSRNIIITIFYPYYDINLEIEIKKRKQTNVTIH